MMLQIGLHGRQHLSSAKKLASHQNLLQILPCHFSTALEEAKAKDRSLRPEPRPPKMKMEPYVKNLFRGKIDQHVFAYPELDQGSLNIVEDMKTEMEKFMNSENISTLGTGCKVSMEHISKLKELGIFKSNIPREYGGLELTCSEMISLAEVFGRDSALFHTLDVHLNYISTLFCNFARNEQKEKYLPLLASGDLQIGFALWEENSGVDVSRLDCSATFLGDSYVLTGKKRWVCNGGIADKFVVFAREGKAQTSESSDSISCFLVDKHAEGISAKSMETLGVNGYNAWEVTFDKTAVPKENVIGETGQGLSILRSLLHGKFTLTGGYTGLLRDLLNTAVHHAINRETFGKPLIENEMVQQHIAQAAARLYALESITYMTADFYDNIEDPDIEVESAIVRLYSCESLMWIVQKCLTVIGSDSYVKDKPYERILRDALFSPMVESSTDTLRMTIALLCLQHVGAVFQERVVERRNPLFYPQRALKYFYNKHVKLYDDIDYQAIIHNHVHPSLEVASESLEKAILKVGRITEETLMKWGSEIDVKQMNLARLADIAVELYTATAVLARASRSIGIGLRNCDVDGNMAHTIVLDACDKIELLIKSLEDSPFNNNDANNTRIAKAMLHERKYYAAHPLARNF